MLLSTQLNSGAIEIGTERGGACVALQRPAAVLASVVSQSRRRRRSSNSSERPGLSGPCSSTLSGSALAEYLTKVTERALSLPESVSQLVVGKSARRCLGACRCRQRCPNGDEPGHDKAMQVWSVTGSWGIAAMVSWKAGTWA